VEIVGKNMSLYVQQCCGKKCFKLLCVLFAVQFVSHKLHGKQYTPQLETLFTTTLLNIQRRIFTDYFHKIVTLARSGIGSLMMVQVDRNM
jgi:hypothetical protein